MIAVIADDRREIELGSIFCNRLRSIADDRNGSQTMVDECFHMIGDRRTHDSAIACDRLRSYGNQGRVVQSWVKITQGLCEI